MTPTDVSTPTRSRLGVTTLLKAGGGALGALAVGAVVAALTTTVVFQDNSASTTRLPVSLVEIAPLDGAQTCDDPRLVWEVTDRVQGVTAEFDLVEALARGGDAWKVGVVDVCVRSISPRATALTLRFADVVDSEVTCEEGEEEAGDGCAEPGDPGELTTQLRTTTGGPTAGRCISSFFVDQPISATSVIDASTLSGSGGRTCRLTLGLSIPDTLQTQQLALLQTDRLQFDLVLTASQS